MPSSQGSPEDTDDFMNSTSIIVMFLLCAAHLVMKSKMSRRKSRRSDILQDPRVEHQTFSRPSAPRTYDPALFVSELQGDSPNFDVSAPTQAAEPTVTAADIRYLCWPESYSPS